MKVLRHMRAGPIGAAFGGLVLISAPLSPAQAATADRPQALPGTAAQRPANAIDLGAAPSGELVDFGILLRMRDQAGAEARLSAISDPTSASYGKWLTNAEFDASYAPAGADVAAVESWLRARGLTVRKTLPSGMYVEVSGTVAQVEQVFATQVRSYSWQGQTLRAITTAPSLPGSAPARVRSAIHGVIGIDQFSTLKHPAAVEPGPPPGSRYGVQPCSGYFGQLIAQNKPTAYGQKAPYAVCGYTPRDYQSAYGETSLLAKGVDGRGITVAITDAYASPTIYQDAQRYSTAHQQPLFRQGQFSQITPAADGYHMVNACGAQGWYGEETLDVEAVHAMAPGASIVFVGASDCASGLDEAWAETIDNHIADVVTNSWGDSTDDITMLGASYVAFYLQYSIEAALTGITVNFASGDDGDQTDGGADLADKSVDFPADLPFVTGVGGTSILIGAEGQWLGEHGWQNDYTSLKGGAWSPPPPGNYSSGGGGGTSQLFLQPAYQVGKVPVSISRYYGGAPMRAVPDIAVVADPNTGFRVGQTQVFPDGTYWAEYRIGGTSLASPLLAGMVAVADQARNTKLGFINPLYYQMLYTPALHHLTAPTSPIAQVRTDFTNFVDNSQGVFFRLQTIDVQSSTLHDTRGYDDETGVGSPHGPMFFTGEAAH